MQATLDYRTNRDLFSNYYLDEHLPETEAWNDPTETELRDAKQDILELWEREKDTAPQRNESQLEEKFIRPMFRKLGIPFEVEESVDRSQRRPDYGFFDSDDAARDAFDRREAGGDFYEHAVAVADAKRWGRPLDTRGSGEHERDFENPSYQIHVYLQEVDTVQWAVLTDGRKWRLYYGPTSHRLDSYYEIDLPTILEDGDLEDFKYFYLFFRHTAFLEDASGDCFLDEVYEESNIFAQELGEDLQDNIYEAIKILADGFLQYSENDLSDDDLDLIHDSSLIFLYRLIFVLYSEAEGRELLDTDNPIYKESYSLNSLKQEIAEELDSPNPKYHDWQDDLWDRLDELFKLIDQGSKSRGIPEEDLYIPAYNGGLFRTDPDEDDSVEARFLAKHKVGDAYLAEVIDLLTRSRNGNGGEKIFVDYSSLDVRHLGSIYEGLLEYQLNVADEPLALADSEYVPAGEGDEVIVEKGEVHLTTGSGERKATGSFYTPEYVVEYIVEETLGPLVDDIRSSLVGQSAFDEGGFAEEFAEEVFDLKILDPAMGSGHFLTSAIDYLAREIIDAQERQAAQQGIETVDEEHDINWARRQVAQRCIYGVDVNPLAVELAKVSLWLRTLASEQPLAFLDHHLKTGNSLAGSDIQEVLGQGKEAGDSNGQLTLEQSFARTRKHALEHVMERFQNLLSIDNQTLEDIKEMESVYDDVREDPLYQHLLSMANVHTASRFGLDIPEDADKRMAQALRDGSWENIENQDWFKTAQRLADQEKFFHWELELPVAFYDKDGSRKEDAGFDAVIGNPPYVLIDKSSRVGGYYEASFMTASGYKPDLYMPFVEKSTRLAMEQGNIGLIIPNRFFLTKSGSNLRDYLSERDIREIIDFGQSKVFGDALNYVCILSLSPSLGNTDTFTYTASDATMTNTQSHELPVEAIQGDTWSFPDQDLIEITQKIDSNSVPLGDVLVDMFAGAQTGADEILLRDEPIEGEENVFVPFLRSKDIRRYRTNRDAEYVIFPYDDTGEILSEEKLSEEYPETHKYLEKHRDDLEDRVWHNQGPIERSGKWYGLMYLPDPERFMANKIVCPYLASKTVFTYDTEESIFGTGAGYGIEISGDQDRQKSFVCLLNSTLANTLFMQVSPEFQSGFKFNKTYVEQIPIPEVVKDDFDIPVDKILPSNREARKRSEGTIGELLSTLYDTLRETLLKRHSLNLSLQEYLGNYDKGPNLPDVGLYQPTSSNILDATTEDYEKLQIENIRTVRDGRSIMIEATARYKPEDDNAYETDTWGYTETEYFEAFTLTDLTNKEAALIEAFVPVAVEKGIGGFRESATKTNSIKDRLKAITLPNLNDVEGDLERFIKTKERAEELDERIHDAEQLVDDIVYNLYNLTDEEIDVVESTTQNG